MKAFSLVCLLGAAAVFGADQPVISVTEQTVFEFYRSFPRLTKQPHYVAPLTALLCTSPTPELIEREKVATGPHYRARVHIYSNSIALITISRKLGTFSTGAVLVKEKLDEQGSPIAVGGMVKRAPGYSPEQGDWEYFYAPKVGGFSIGRLQNCAACHAETRTTDYVYSVWKPFL